MTDNGYGLWFLVVFNSLLFIFFAASFFHPQYTGFVLITVGFLLQWPTFATLLMFPVLLVVYRRLAVREERDVAAEFGAAWEAYASDVPRFVPRLRQRAHGDSLHPLDAKPAPLRVRSGGGAERRPKP